MNLIRKTFNERNVVVILFVMVLLAFSFAQRETKKIEKLYLGYKVKSSSPQFTSTDKIITPKKKAS
ncbi:MAG: hypothetical protein ABUT20_06400 [Bacteroidota bacterium]